MSAYGNEAIALSVLLSVAPTNFWTSLPISLQFVNRLQSSKVWSAFQFYFFFLPYLTLKWQHLLLEIVRTAKLFSGFVFFFFGDLQRGKEVIWGLISSVSLWRLLAINQLAPDASKSSWVRFKILGKKKSSNKLCAHSIYKQLACNCLLLPSLHVTFL